MRVLITGGFGFVGGRVAQYLRESGHKIILCTRENGESPEWLPLSEVKNVNWNNDVELYKVCQGVDVIVHAAGMNAQACAADPVEAFAFNSVATARLVAAAVRAKVKKFIYISTAHVYGSPLTATITEDTCPRNLHPYATSHLAGEYAVQYASHKGEIQGVVLRLSNAFGAPAHKDADCWMLLVNDLCRQALTARRLVLHSSGLQYRDFVPMEQVCRVIGWLLGDDTAKQFAGIFNVGSGVSQTVLEVAQLIQERCKQVFGFEPELQRPAAAAWEHHEPFHYNGKNLKKAGFQSSLDQIGEIDNLLRFCEELF